MDSAFQRNDKIELMNKVIFFRLRKSSQTINKINN